MTRRITRHPSDPTPDQGAITVWSEREHAVSAFRISAPAGAVELLDLDRRVSVPAHGPAAVEDVLGPIVFPDVASYRRGSAWQLATVLEKLGLDAGELAEVEIADDEALFGLACDDSSHDLRDGACTLCGMLEGDVPKPEAASVAWVEAPTPYDFAKMPPGIDWPDNVEVNDLLKCAQDVVYDFRNRAGDAAQVVYLTPETLTLIRGWVQHELDARWPGLVSVQVTLDGERRIVTTMAPVVDPARHATAWQWYTLHNDPRGYEFIEGPGGWRWTHGPSILDTITTQTTAAEIAADLQAAADAKGLTNLSFLPRKRDRAAARADAWDHYLEEDARALVDLLAMAGLWPETFDPATNTYGAASGPDIEYQRLVWVQGWTLLDRGLASAWAVATHLSASDNDDVEIPPAPACLEVGRPR